MLTRIITATEQEMEREADGELGDDAVADGIPMGGSAVRRDAISMRDETPVGKV
jgi:hypothetical protein